MIRMKPTAVVAIIGATVIGLTGCSTPSDGGTQAVKNASGENLNLTSDQKRITAPKDDAIAATVPAAIRGRGTLLIGQGVATGSPPFAFPSTNDSDVWIGDEIDIATLVAGVLGLTPEFRNSSWEGLFLGIDSGTTDVGFSNITVTETRKEIYDFATYRDDILSLIVLSASTLKFDGYQNLAGKTIAVSSGTNQEKVLIGYSNKLKADGKTPITIKYFQDTTSVWAALTSGQIDGYFGPNPVNAFHDAQVRGTPNETKVVGTVSGAGEGVKGLIAATTKKGNPLITAIRAAINKVISDGAYQKVLDRWNLGKEAVAKSELNPPGLTNS